MQSNSENRQPSPFIKTPDQHGVASAEGARPLLELTTHFDPVLELARPLQGQWVLKLFKSASEASGSFQRAPRSRSSAYRGVRGAAVDPERSAAMAARRAGTKLRRYVVANRLNRLGTLTYAEACNDEREVRKDVGEFFRALRVEVGTAFPYLWVPEWHPQGHGLHLHFVVGRYVPRSKISDAWGRGFVHIKLLGQVPIGQGSLGESRHAASYLAKYLRKGFDDQRTFNFRRFDAARGFTPKPELLVGRSAEEVTSAACDRIGAQPSYVWRSRDHDGWIGPNAMWMTWDR